MKKSIYFLLSLLLPACATVPDDGGKQTYRSAMQAVQQGRYEMGLEQLQLLQQQADSEQMRLQTEVGLTYIYYKKGELVRAREACEKFIQRNPAYVQLAYVYYLRGLITAKQGEIHLQKITENVAVPANAYPEALRQAYQYFSSLVKNFPQSSYAEQAVKHSQELRWQLARFELHVARYDILQGDYDEAVRRARYVNQYFSDPLTRKKALTVLSKAYKASGDKEQAALTDRQLEELATTIKQP